MSTDAEFTPLGFDPDVTAGVYVPTPLSVQLSPHLYTPEQRQASHARFQAACDELGAGVRALVTPFKEVWDAYIASIQPVLELIAPILRTLSEQVWRLYEDAGAPYGDTHEGLMRWLREAGEANRLRSEAEAIEQRWRDQADLREWGRRMRARRDREG